MTHTRTRTQSREGRVRSLFGQRRTVEERRQSVVSFFLILWLRSESALLALLCHSIFIVHWM